MSRDDQHYTKDTPEEALAFTLINILEGERKVGHDQNGHEVLNGDPPTWRVVQLFRHPIIEYRNQLEKSVSPALKEQTVVTSLEGCLIRVLADYTEVKKTYDAWGMVTGKRPCPPNDELIRKFMPHILEYRDTITDRGLLIELLRKEIQYLNGRIYDLCPDVGF